MASAFTERRAAGQQRFPDRAYAGLLLGRLLVEEQKPFDPERTVVAALPRGGVAVGVAVAGCLRVPLEVLVTRKIGHPAVRGAQAGWHHSPQAFLPPFDRGRRLPRMSQAFRLPALAS